MDELLHDLEALKKVADNAGLYLDDENGLAVVRLSLDTSFLEKTTAKHWGVNNRKPVIIELKFDSHTYLRSAEPPAIFIFQSDDPKLSHPALSDYETEFGIVQWFLETRMNKILRANWNRRPASFLEVLPPPPALDLLDDDVAAEIPLEQVDADKTEEDQVALGELFSDEWELRPEGEGKTIHIVKNPRVHDSAFDVGRGPLSGIDDVLLSRRQLIITLDSEEQVITARSAGGVNPSFFRRYHSDQVLSIPAEAQVELRPGDRIWLLENAYPYRVLGPKEAFRTKQQLADQEKGTAGGGDNIKAGEEEEEVEGKRAAPQVDGQRNPPKRQKTFDVDDTSPWAEKAKEVHAILPGIPADKIIAALILKEGDLEQVLCFVSSPSPCFESSHTSHFYHMISGN